MQDDTREELEHAIGVIDFPASKAQIANRVSEHPIPVKGKTLYFGDLLSNVPDQEYESGEALLEQLRARVPDLGEK